MPGISVDAFLTDFRKLVASLMAAFVGLIFGLRKNNENFVYIGFLVSIIVLILIAYSRGNFALLGFSSMKVQRDRFFFNANYYSYISYFANISILYLHLRYKNKLTFILTLVLPFLFLALAFITQSRSGLLFVLLVNTFFWLFINKSTNAQNSLFKIVRFIGVLAVGIFLAIQLNNVYQKSNIAQRFSSSGDDSRAYLARQGIELFIEHPLLGIGLGQFPMFNRSKQFTHNSYAEALSEHGIIGGIILLVLFFFPFFKGYSLLRKFPKNPFLKLHLLFFITFLLYNNFFVFYKVPYAMLYFFMFIGLQYRLALLLSKPSKANAAK
ncbi:O-antigen ligase family protein [Flagellimonas lutaonensis]|nr:O-antigen ligase family protein [Allomuricauda lutaonensis]